MKWLLLFPIIAFGGTHTKSVIKDQFIIKGSQFIQGQVVRKLGRDIYLVKSKNKLTVDNKTIFHNYQYTGEFKESNPVNDTLFSDQIHLSQIKAPKAWEISQGSSEVIVAVTDNEFELDHDDLKHAWWKNEKEIPNNNIDDDGNGYIDDVIGWDFVTNDSNVDVAEGPTHGTHVAGIIAAKVNNNLGVAGIAPKVKVMPLRWYGDERSWNTALVVETYHYAINMGAKIINTSYNIDPLVEDPAYLDVIQFVKNSGAIIFNSAGNDNKKNPPRSVIKDIVLVCSVKSKKARHLDKKSRFSNYGKEIDICAPGDPILSTVQRRYLGESRYGELDGTSMSSPIAASVAALIWSHNPNFSREEVINKLIKSADNIDDKNKARYKGLLGSGRVNALKALK